MPRTLAQNAQYIANTIKPAIKSAIEAQGVTVPSTDSFLDYADRIGEIEGGGSGYQLKDLPTGSISTVNDAAELPLNALKVSVKAVQDLHGYDHPWVGGAGKNQYPIMVGRDAFSNNAGGTHSSGTDELTINCVSGSNASGVYTTSNSTIRTVLARLAPCYVSFDIVANTTANVLVGNDGSSGKRIGTTKERWSVYFAGEYNFIAYGLNNDIILTISNFMISKDEANQYEPYSNICPIEGWNSGDITVCEKNLCNENDIIIRDNRLCILGKSYGGTSTDWVWLKKGKYTISVDYGNIERTANLRFYMRTLEMSLSQLGGTYTANGATEIFELNKDTKVQLFLYSSQTTWNNSDLDVTKVMLNYGETATTYEPYQGNQYTQQFPQTIYGAEWDVVSGELKQTDGYIASYNGETLPSTWISDRDVYASGTTPTTGAEVVYKLATPTAIQLSPLSIRMLQGTNNVYADCGEVIEGEYFVNEGAIDVRKVDYQIGSSGSIKTTDGRVLSGFASMNDYHARPLDASGNWLDVDWSKDFEIGVAFKTSSVASSQYLFGSGISNTFYSAPYIGVYSGGDIEIAGYYSGSTTHAFDVLAGVTLQADKWYAIKVVCDYTNDTFTTYLSEDLSTWTAINTQNLTDTLRHDSASLGLGGLIAQSQYSSNDLLIDTFNTYIKGDGVNWGAFTGVFPS